MRSWEGGGGKAGAGFMAMEKLAKGLVAICNGDTNGRRGGQPKGVPTQADFFFVPPELLQAFVPTGLARV